MYLYIHFYNLSFKGPKIFIRKKDIRTNKVYSHIQYKTLNLPCLNYYYDLFYKNKKKVIPDNLMEIITPVSLAF